MPSDGLSPAWPAADIRRLRIRSSHLVTSLFAGEYRSVFRGRGIEFESMREYQPGDDIRDIDWNVTARSGRPYVKQYVEERERTVMLLLDLSPSLTSDSPRGPKHNQAAEACALLAFAAARSNDKVGLLTFTDRVEHYLPPRKGTRHAQRLVAQILTAFPKGHGTDLTLALDHLQRVQRRNAIVFLVSDFQAPDFRLALTAAARRHEVVAVSLNDPLDAQLPSLGVLDVLDPENGTRRLVDSRSSGVRLAYAKSWAESRARLKETFAAAGIEHLALATDSPAVLSLTRFFLDRQRRMSR
jgi:uncharacterized protein (DUF58 family)